MVRPQDRAAGFWRGWCGNDEDGEKDYCLPSSGADAKNLCCILNNRPHLAFARSIFRYLNIMKATDGQLKIHPPVADQPEYPSALRCAHVEHDWCSRPLIATFHLGPVRP